MAALLYVALPTLIFLIGWLRWWAALPLVTLTVVSIAQYCRRSDVAWTQPYTRPALFFIIVIAFVWASLGGAGHFFETNPDWLIRDKVLGDLTLTPWPPAYQVGEVEAHLLRSAFGFFLPAAVVGKLFGIAWVDVALFIYCALGCSLFFLLLPLTKRLGWPLFTLLLTPIFFSGMDYLGIVLITGTTPIFPLRLEWWVPFSYSSFTGQMHWAPNHVIPVWLVTLLFYRHWGHRAWPALFMVMLPLTVIWTPFAVAAIFPFLVFGIIAWFRSGLSFFDARISVVQLGTALLLSALTVRFITLDLAAIPTLPSEKSAAHWSLSTDQIADKYLLFTLMEFGILALLLARGVRHSFGIFWIACALLVVIPWLKFGPSNDLILRLSIPCLLVLMIALMLQIQDALKARTTNGRVAAIVLVFLIGAATPFNEMFRALFNKRTPPDYSRSLVEQHWNTEPPHYVGVANSTWLNSVLRAPTRVPSAAERKANSDANAH